MCTTVQSLKWQESCQRHDENAMRDTCNLLENAIYRLEELSQERDDPSKEVGFSFCSYSYLNNVFRRVYLNEIMPVCYHYLSQMWR
jgi:hypothetical protein